MQELSPSDPMPSAGSTPIIYSCPSTGSFQIHRAPLLNSSSFSSLETSLLEKFGNSFLIGLKSLVCLSNSTITVDGK